MAAEGNFSIGKASSEAASSIDRSPVSDKKKIVQLEPIEKVRKVSQKKFYKMPAYEREESIAAFNKYEEDRKKRDKIIERMSRGGVLGHAYQVNAELGPVKKKFVVTKAPEKPVRLTEKSLKGLTPQKRAEAIAANREREDAYDASRAGERERGKRRASFTRGGIASIGYQAGTGVYDSAELKKKPRGKFVSALTSLWKYGIPAASLFFPVAGMPTYKNHLPVEGGPVSVSTLQETAEVAPELKGPEWAPVSFEAAFRAAERAHDITGVDTDFILAVMAQESGWDPEAGTMGHNIGDCRILSPEEAERLHVPFGTGRRISRNELIPQAINMGRDWGPFLQITAALGLDPYQTPISCPVWNEQEERYEWFGGAMGPTQVLPSSWLPMSERIPLIAGSAAASPWNINDAAVATGLHLKDDGATTAAMTPAEAVAAASYYTGASRHRSPEGQAYRRGIERLMREMAPFIEDMRERDIMAGAESRDPSQRAASGSEVGGRQG